jgi:uncharacterized membrane protein
MPDKKLKKIIIISKFFIPIILCISIYGFIGMIFEENLRLKYWSLISAYFFPPLGKESVIPAGVAFGFNPLAMALSIAFIDIFVALFLLWNYDLAKKIPLVGKFIEKIENIGKNSSNKYAWVKPLRFIGIILFVIIPFQGSGGVVGSIIGRLFGMKPLNTFLAISIGALFGCILVAYFTEALLKIFQTNLMQGLLIFLIILITAIMIYIYIENYKK